MPETVYRKRDPQNTAHYQCIEDHFEAFDQVYEDRFERQYGFFRAYVRQVIHRYLDCGVLTPSFHNPTTAVSARPDAKLPSQLPPPLAPVAVIGKGK